MDFDSCWIAYPSLRDISSKIRIESEVITGGNRAGGPYCLRDISSKIRIERSYVFAALIKPIEVLEIYPVK